MLSSFATCFPLRRVISTEACQTPEDWLDAASKSLPLSSAWLGSQRGTDTKCKFSSAQTSDLLTNARPWLLAARAAHCPAVLVLDLQFVGADQGVGTTNACRILSVAEPGFEWLSGGGVRTGGDVERLQAAGCSGVLVGPRFIKGLGPQASR